MKRVRILTGVKRIEDADNQATLLKLRDLLAEHRALLISRVVSGLQQYIDYRFSIKVTNRQTETVRDVLLNLRSSVLDLDRYAEIVDHFYTHELTHIGTEPFYREIDENIANIIHSQQLSLVQ